MEALKAKLQRVWEHRLGQNFEEVRSELVDLKRELALPVGLLNNDIIIQYFQNVEEQKVSLAAEAILVSISVYRAEGQLILAQQLLQQLEMELQKRQMAPLFQVYYQKGLNFGAQGDMSSALETFLICRYYTDRPEEKVYALSNAMICLDNLGLPFEKTRMEVDKILSEIQSEKSEYFQRSVHQLMHFELKYDLRNGKLAPLMEYKNAGAFDQVDYLKAWMSSLPYHRYFVSFERLNLEDFSLATPYFYKKSYRLRTLQGLMHPHDETDFNETEFSDRFYLWTWKWLTSSETFSLSRVMSLFKSTNFVQLSQKISDEDYYLIRNALYWMSLFDPSSQMDIERILKSMRPHNGRTHLLWNFEHDVQMYLFSVRDGKSVQAQDILQNLKLHPLWNSEELLFKTIIESLESGQETVNSSLSGLIKNLKALQPKPTKSENSKATLHIDLSTDQITDLKKKQTVTSDIMARAFDILHKKQSVTCDEFLLATFGLYNYDSFLHDQKIFNLLARMRAYNIEELRIGVKSGKVFASGSWAQVNFSRPLREDYRLDNRKDWQNLLKTDPDRQNLQDDKLQKWIKPNLLIKKLSDRPEFTREDIEEIAGISRSTANRLLKGWMDQGLVDRKGSARNTVYFFAEGKRLVKSSFELSL